MGLLVLAWTAHAPAGPNGSGLRWLPYRPADGGSDAVVQVAQRTSDAQPSPSHNPFRQVAASAFEDPFGDAAAGATRARPAGRSGDNPIRNSAAAQVPGAMPAPSFTARPLTGPNGTGAAPRTPVFVDPIAEAPALGAGAPDLPPRKSGSPAEKSAVQPDRLQAEVQKIEKYCPPPERTIDEITDNIEVSSELKSAEAAIRDLECPLVPGKLPSRETPGGWCETTFTWKASALCHKPLYFNQEHVERYGHSAGPLAQPILSAGRFFLTVPVLPYEMGLNPPGECVYTLGYYRPGSCAPYYLEPIPFTVRAGLAEAGAWLGAVYIIP